MVLQIVVKVILYLYEVINMTTASMNFKTDRTTKEKFNKVAKKLGLTTSSLLNLFVTRVAREQAVPFDVKVVPDKEELDLDEESKKEMIRVLAVENGLIEDTDKDVKSLDKYFKDLGI